MLLTIFHQEFYARFINVSIDFLYLYYIAVGARSLL